jgi:hypothetical protein
MVKTLSYEPMLAFCEQGPPLVCPLLLNAISQSAAAKRKMGSQRRSRLQSQNVNQFESSTRILSNNFSYQSHSLRLYRCAATSSGADRDPPMSNSDQFFHLCTGILR